MNREKIQELRDHIAKLPPEQFDMRQWRDYNDCGTVACIAGWAVEINKSLFVGEYVPRSDIRGAARMVLQLSDLQAVRLFTPMESSHIGVQNNPGAIQCDMQDVTTAQAVKVLDNLLLTGEVDWRVTHDDEVL